MLKLAKLVDQRPDGVFVRRNGVPVTLVTERFLRGEVIAELTPIEVLAAIAFETLGPDDLLGPSLSNGSVKNRAIQAISIDEMGSRLCPNAGRSQRLALAAGIFQIFDAWDLSHEAAQLADDLGDRQTSSYWHAIAHRREPDPGNANYWFRRIGPHPVFERLLTHARTIMDGIPLQQSLFHLGEAWDSIRFVAFCEAVRPDTIQEMIARKIQRAEMITLLGFSASVAGLE